MTAADVEKLKHAAAAKAVEFVRPGMRLGLGTGSTAKHFVTLLAERVRGGLDIIAVPTSEATRADAERQGVPPHHARRDYPRLDLTVDGADEIAPDLSVIKGGGGALLREKIVAAASARMIVIADDSKVRGDARPRFPAAPIEVVPFGLAATRRAVEAAPAGRWLPGRGADAPDPRGPCFRHGWRAPHPRRRARRASRGRPSLARAARRHPGRGRARPVHRALHTPPSSPAPAGVRIVEAPPSRS